MKNVLVVGVTIALLYLGYDFLNPPPLPPPVVVRAMPAPAPKVYFHSALDAGPMPANQHTGTSYFSTDPDPRFTGRPYSDSGYSSLNGSQIVYGTASAPGVHLSSLSSPLIGAAAQADAQRAATSRASAFKADQQARARALQVPIGTAR